MTRPDTFPNATEFMAFVERNCSDCVEYRYIVDDDFGLALPMCPVLNNLELEQAAQATPRRLAFVDEHLDADRLHCSRRSTQKISKPLEGQIALEGVE